MRLHARCVHACVRACVRACGVRWEEGGDKWGMGADTKSCEGHGTRVPCSPCPWQGIGDRDRDRGQGQVPGVPCQGPYAAGPPSLPSAPPPRPLNIDPVPKRALSLLSI